MGGADYGPCPSCATGYVMSQAMARTLVTTDFCSPADSALFGACWPCCGWIRDFHERVGRLATEPFKCTWESDPSHTARPTDTQEMRGIFQQDPGRFAGVHQGAHLDQPEAQAEWAR